jgi:acetyltransferase-like isoleucine patch superfamily enzyme
LEDEVWLGTKYHNFSGVNIGKGAIIASGLDCNKRRLHSIYGGNPAKLIK